MQEFEKLGVFYLGKEFDVDQGKQLDNYVLYKSKNLTTHAVIIGMTGSGKTGLGIGLLEEAAIDNIPVIAIDPKGDMANMALTFSNLSAEEFEPWINANEAADKGFSRIDYAKKQADMWRNGLDEWGQGLDRIKRYKEAVDITVYTPGGSSGVSVSVLKSFEAPPKEIINDIDDFSDRINATATSLLALIGIDADPITSREHILVSNILEYEWKNGKNLSIENLIGFIQSPPIEKIGVLSLENFYPSKDRFELAMKLNSLLASPSFKTWLEGVPLNIQNFLYSEDGKPNVSVFSIAHLSESERMFFVSMLLNEIVAWMRTQPGTGSLRALLYMDEMYGYLPPVANPPSKKPFMTLLKQARAYGLGLILSTQNPVDLDYKALSNTGTWFIGRLQTERDKERVLAGLEGASLGAKFDKQKVEQILAGLRQRLFYLHNVHEDKPLIFNTRWVMSYLAGPLTRDQIKLLPKEVITKKNELTNDSLKEQKKIEKVHIIEEEVEKKRDDLSGPVIPGEIKQVFLPRENSLGPSQYYSPNAIAIADVRYTSSKYGVNVSKRQAFLTPLHRGPIVLDWKEAKKADIDLNNLDTEPENDIKFLQYPQEATQKKSYDKWKSSFRKYLRSDKPLELFYSFSLEESSKPDETEREFRIRIQHLAHEKRDLEMEEMKIKYESKIRKLEERKRNAEQTLEQKSSLAKQRKIEAAVSTGVAIFGALFGTKTLTKTSVSKVGTAMRSANKAMQSGTSIEQAEEDIKAVENQILLVQQELERELETLAQKYNIMEEELQKITISPTYSNIIVHLVGLAWKPVAKF
jgi:hypothetical protein